MKVVLFCGGQGMRIRKYNDEVPKPMIKIGSRPVLWHIMKYYAHFGHKDFVLCLGYKADVIKQYFLNYKEWVSNDFVVTNGGRDIELFDSDIDDWTITLVDTGVEACVGERLWAVRDLLKNEEAFMCNYADCLTDCDLPTMIEHFHDQGKVGSFMGIPPNYSFHVIQRDATGAVTDLVGAKESDLRINGGYFIFTPDLFDYMRPGEELVVEPFRRLIAAGELTTYIHNDFWGCMDTFKEKMMLEDMYQKGGAPWEIWREHKSRIVRTTHRSSTPTAAEPANGSLLATS
jgi:glucose-1-phosphate cytidylyltransferase